jgi:hypothetical protein
MAKIRDFFEENFKAKTPVSFWTKNKRKFENVPVVDLGVLHFVVKENSNESMLSYSDVRILCNTDKNNEPLENLAKNTEVKNNG